MQINSNSIYSELPSPIIKSVPMKSKDVNVAGDSLSLNEMSEELHQTDALNNRHSILQGSINKQDAMIKMGYNYDSENHIYAIEAEGTIGSKKIVIHQDLSQNVKGSYNNKDFDLNLDIKYDDKYKHKIGHHVKSVYINGTIDNKPFNITMPNDKVPQDSDTKDILTTLLSLNYIAPFTIDGKIIDIIPSHMAYETSNYHFQNQCNAINEAKSFVLPALFGCLITTVPKAMKAVVNYLKK